MTFDDGTGRVCAMNNWRIRTAGRIKVDRTTAQTMSEKSIRETNALDRHGRQRRVKIW